MSDFDLPHVASLIDSEAFRQLNARTATLFIVCMVPRPGGAEFFSKLEHAHYPPGTPANDLFNIYIHHWQGFPWTIVSIPWRDKHKADEIAGNAGMRLANGYPIMFKGRRPDECFLGNTRLDKVKDASEVIDRFPLDSDRTFTLEQQHGPHKGPVPAALVVQPIGTTDTAAFLRAVGRAARDTDNIVRALRAGRN